MGKIITRFSSYAMCGSLFVVLLSGCSNVVSVSDPDESATTAGKSGATGESGSVGVLDQGNQSSNIPPELAQAIEDIINE